MIQIGLVMIGCGLIWLGVQGFRECGIQLSSKKSPREPLKGLKGRVVGGILMAIGAGFLGFALIASPMMVSSR